jgi:hypothetical protein
VYWVVGVPITTWLSTNQIVRSDAGAYYMVDDDETGRIINHLGGCQSADPEWELRMMRLAVRSEYSRAGATPPADLATFSYDQIISEMATWESKEGFRIRDWVLNRVFADLSETATKAPVEEPGPTACAEIWELVNQHGAPKIRLVEEQNDLTSVIIAAIAPRGEEQAAYVPTTNTIYIQYDGSLEVLIDELGHAKQFREHYWQSHVRWFAGTLRSTRCIPSGIIQGLQRGYGSEYDRPGSLEHEAHRNNPSDVLASLGLKVKDVDPKLPYAPRAPRMVGTPEC